MPKLSFARNQSEGRSFAKKRIPISTNTMIMMITIIIIIIIIIIIMIIRRLPPRLTR